VKLYIYCAAEKYSPNYCLPEHWTEVNGKPGLNALRRRSDRVTPRTGPVSLVKVTGSRPPGIEIWFFDSLDNNMVIIRTELRLCVGSVRKVMELHKRH
jgi:hypothetical protein